MTNRLFLSVVLVLSLILSISSSRVASANEYPAGNIKVLPVLFIPAGRENLAKKWTSRFNSNNIHAYLKVAQKKWQQLLGGTAFEYERLKIIQGTQTVNQYIVSGQVFGTIQSEVLNKLGVNPNIVPTPKICNFDKIVLLLVAGGNNISIGSGGNWCSYGIKNGPGAAILGIDYFFKEGTLTSTLVHEIGHGLGLVHSWQRPSSQNPMAARNPLYGQSTSNSVMSYNIKNQTNSVNIADVKGSLLSVELFELAQNKRALPEFAYKGTLSPAHQVFATNFRHPIQPINKPYDINTVWRSPTANKLGWVSMGITLPRPRTVDKIVVYTGTRKYSRRADMVQIEFRTSLGRFKFLKRVANSTGRIVINFNKTTAQEWKVSLHTKKGKQVDLRGVRFFRGKSELYPPKKP